MLRVGTNVECQDLNNPVITLALSQIEDKHQTLRNNLKYWNCRGVGVRIEKGESKYQY